MPATQLKFLNAARINGIMQGLQDPRLISNQLVWRNRIPMVNSVDEEIMARFVGQVLIADLIADDARANVYSQGKFSFETTKVPNIKMGVGLNQAMLNMLGRLQAGAVTANDQGIFTQWENRTINAVKTGVDQRMEALLVAMLVDGLSYDRLGIKMNGVTWGMPADLKVTPTYAWTDATNATPISDINTVRRVARIRYGVELNRISLSSAALEFATKTNEFKEQSKLWGFGMFNSVPQPALPYQGDAMMREMFQRMLGGQGQPMTIETYDSRYWSQDTAGAISSQPFLPLNKVILTNSGNDGNGAAYDFANGTVTETIVGSLTDAGIIGDFAGPQTGPVAYSTGTHNPPGITYWGAARGFPRKHAVEASACLTVGTISETVALGVPFPL